MLKVGSNGASRAGIIGELNSLPDADSSFSYDIQFSLTGLDAPVIESSESDEPAAVKAVPDHIDLDISDKGWMIERGFLNVSLTEFEMQGRSSPLFDEPLLNVTVGGSVSGVIDITGDTDDIQVFLVAGQTYLVSLRGTGAEALNDSFLEVFDPTAALVNYNDDGGNGLYSIMTFTAAATGNYTIRASSFSNPGDPGTGGYTVDVRVQGADAIGDTNGTSVVIGQGTTFGFRETATVSGGNDLDRYQVTLEAGKFYTFKLAAGADYETDYLAVPLGEIDTILRLRNSAGTLVAQNDDVNFPSDLSSGFGFLAQTSGTYYIDVTGYSGQTGGYILEWVEVPLADEDPVDSIRWFSADNIDTVDVDGAPTAFVYFGAAGETFGEPGLVTFGWNDKEKAAVMSALLEYTKITGITYVETADINVAEFRLNTVSTGGFGAYFYPQDPAYGTQQGIGIFNVNSGGWDKPGVSTQDIPGDQVSLDKGGFAYAVILHEFGHAHGLAHPHDTGGGSDVMLGVTAATNSFGVFNLNLGVYTVMSYNDAWDFHPDGPTPFTISGIASGWSGTLGAFDIKALQDRYGVTEHNGGDNTYFLSSVQQTGVYYETIWDSGGDDTILYAGTGNARIDLTAATLDYSPTGAGVMSFVDQIPGTAGLDGIFGGYTIANGVVIENAYGGSGNDILIGNAANNILEGGEGADTMIGRGGDDRYYVDNAGDVYTEVADEGRDAVYTTISLTLAAGQHIEALSTRNQAGLDAIDLTGNELDQEIYGNDGANRLEGGGGSDVLSGYGGNDIYRVDGQTIVIESAGGGDRDVIYTTGTFALDAGQDVEVLTTTNWTLTGAIDLTGNQLAGQELYGNNGANVLDGGGGGDFLLGYGGDDTYLIRSAADVVFEVAGDGNDTVLTGISYTLAAGSYVEILATSDGAGTAAIDLTGNELAQSITGNAGANRINGAGGADVLTGGGGADTFIFASGYSAGNNDEITDFEVGIDKIFVLGVTTAQLAAGAFHTGSAAADADDRVIYDSATGALYFDSDGNGAGAAIQFATLQPGLALTAADFIGF